jgi:hypothetical protein
MVQLFRTWSSLYVLGTFFCFAFILVFYDGYRQMYSHAAYVMGAHPELSVVDATEQGRQRIYDTFQETVDFLNERTLIGSPPLTIRHKLRWFYKTGEATVYQAIAERTTVAVSLYVRFAHYAGWLTITFALICATVRRLRGALTYEGLAIIGFVLFSYMALCTSVPHIVDHYSIIEMAAVAAGLYFALGRQLGAFLLALMLAVANREAGAAFGVIYTVINWRDRWFWLPLIAGPAALLALNIDLFTQPAFYAPTNFIVSSGVGFISLFNLGEVSASLMVFIVIKSFPVLAPLAFLIPRGWTSLVGKKLILILGFFLLMLLTGTILGNLLPYLMLLPLMFALAAVADPAHGAARENIGVR